MAFRLAAASRNAAADAVVDRLDLGAGAATIKVYTGSQPATPDTAIGSETLLVTFTLADPAYGSASGGVATLAGLPIAAVAAASGTAGWFRMADSTGAAVADGTVGTTGANLNLDTTTISSGVTVEITGGTVTMPLGS